MDCVKIIKNICLASLIFFPYFFYNLPLANSSGFAIYTHGASSLAQSAATIAHSDHASAIFFNPALINNFEKTRIEMGTTFIFPDREFKSDLTGRTEDGDDEVSLPSTFFATHKLNESWSVGLGVFNPFGLSTDWPDDWEGRYIATTSEMETFNINPVLSCRLTPWMTLAAGLDFLTLDASLEKKINFQPFGLPDGNQEFDGDGEDFGYNLGIVLEPHEDITIGASYRSEIDVDIDGDATFLVPEEVSQSPILSFPNTEADSDITLPEQIHFGIAYKGFAPLTIETAVRWEGWSSFDELKIELDHPVGLLNNPNKIFITERDWEDTWTWSLGLKYRINKFIAVMGGYLYQGNPVPDRTFDPTIPDANGHLFSLGTDLKYKSFGLGLALAYQHLESRHKSNTVDDDPNDSVTNPKTVANGEYETDFYMMGVNLSYRF